MTVTDHTQATLDKDHSHGTGVPNASRADRPQSFDSADFPMPTGREENWRFSPLAALKPLLADEDLPGSIVLDAGELPAGVSVSEIDPAEARRRCVAAPGDRAAVLAASRPSQAFAVTIEPGAVLDAPVTVTMRGDGSAARVVMVVEAGANSEATVVIDRVGQAQLGEFVSVDVGDNAGLTMVLLQQWSDASIHAGEVTSRVGRDGRLRGSVVTLGGAAVRLNTTAAFAGEGGSVDLFGLYFADAGQHFEHQLFVDHAVPNCRSRVTYKGALAGKTARTVWIGDVLIRVAAEGTDTYELNRNLILTEGARADSVPNLEIETGLIEGAGHASATGRFDEEQMFYLRSRGIPEAEARRLVVRGFFADVIQEIGVPAVEDGLLKAIELELERFDD